MKLRSILNQFRLSSDTESSQNRNEAKFSAVESTVSEYVRKSTIHGIAYVGDDERHKFERIWWSIMLVCSIFGASFLIYQAHRTMKENPIIESPALTQAPMWDVPFPAVTICPNPDPEPTPFALNKTNWPDFAQKFLPENFTKSSPNSALFYSVFLQNILLQRDDQDNYDILAQFLPRTKILTAKWLTYLKDVSVTLQKTITDNGACLTFNMYDEKDLLRDGIIPSTFDELRGKKEKLWSRDYGFTDGLPLDNYTYPFRAFNVDDSFSVSFEVDSGQFCLFDSEYGMLLHAPDEVPLYDRHSVYSVITADQFHMVEITPHLVVAEGIEKYDPNVRKCYYTYERKLKYYKTYTRNHCEAECFAEYALAQCGCVPYYMPHFPGTKICGTDLKCFWTANYKLFAPELKAGTAHAPIDDCNCLPTCIQMSYSYQVTPLTRKPGDSGSGLQIRIKAPFFTKNIRTELHSLSEFFSNCGGSLGLFLGVSIFSLVELIYFCTVRLYLHSKRSDRKRCSEKTNEPMNSTFVE